MKKTLINIFIGFLIFFVFQIGFTSIMYGASFIPQEAVRKNMESSADLVCEKEVFFYVADNLTPSMIDRYADSITLNIAWNLGGEDHLKSAVLDEFLTSDVINENLNFKAAVNDTVGESRFMRQYLRYWHGSAALMRFMHLFVSLKEIYIIDGILMAGLVLLNLFLFIRKKVYDLAIAFVTGLAAVSTFFVPLSLEYTWVFMVMLTVTAAVTCIMTGKNGKKRMAAGPKSEADGTKKITACIYVIFIGAMVVNFLDFLTAETLTLTVPLLVMIRLSDSEKKQRNRAAVFSAGAWLIGYAGTWVSKWIISAFVLKENTLPYVTEHIAERLGGEVPGDEITGIGMIFGALGRNIISLFPVGYGAPGIVGAILICVALAYIAYVYRKKEFDVRTVILYAALGLIPYIRYVILHNHSYMHRFFTCRAQMATVMAVILIIFETSDLLRRKRKRR